MSNLVLTIPVSYKPTYYRVLLAYINSKGSINKTDCVSVAKLKILKHYNLFQIAILAYNRNRLELGTKIINYINKDLDDNNIDSYERELSSEDISYLTILETDIDFYTELSTEILNKASVILRKYDISYNTYNNIFDSWNIFKSYVLTNNQSQKTLFLDYINKHLSLDDNYDDIILFEPATLYVDSNETAKQFNVIAKKNYILEKE